MVQSVTLGFKHSAIVQQCMKPSVIYIYIYIYICVCVCVCVCVCLCVLFGPVKPELGVIPSGQKNIQQ